MNTRKIVSVVGARPQFVKAAIVSRALRDLGLAEAVIHTGQHYDVAMSDGLIQELEITNIVENFGVGSGSHAVQTATIMAKFDEYLDHHPEVAAVMVYGDTNSTLAAALVASKRELPIVHVEAGLRSYNRSMPEEVNRVLVDHLSEVLFCSSEAGVDNLRREGIHHGVRVVGDVMLDAFNHYRQVAVREQSAGGVLDKLGGERFAMVTLHRPSNTDDEERFEAIVKSLGQLGMPCLWPVHPRIKTRAGRIADEKNILASEPFSYLQVLHLLSACEVVITDSGGLQKEAYWARRPCVTLRGETEWGETVESGWNTLVDPQAEDLQVIVQRRPDPETWQNLYGDGAATRHIANALQELLD